MDSIKWIVGLSVVFLPATGAAQSVFTSSTSTASVAPSVPTPTAPDDIAAPPPPNLAKPAPVNVARQTALAWSQAIETGALTHAEIRARFLGLTMVEREAILDAWVDVAAKTKKSRLSYKKLVEVQERWINQQDTERRLVGLKERIRVDREMNAEGEGGLMVGAFFAGLGGMIVFRVLYAALLAASGVSGGGLAILVVVLELIGTPVVTAGGAYLVGDQSEVNNYRFFPALAGAELSHLLFLVLAGVVAQASTQLAVVMLVLDLAAVPLGAVAGLHLGRNFRRRNIASTPFPARDEDRLPRARFARLSLSF